MEPTTAASMAVTCDCPERDPFIGCPRPEHQTEKIGIAPDRSHECRSDAHGRCRVCGEWLDPLPGGD